LNVVINPAGYYLRHVNRDRYHLIIPLEIQIKPDEIADKLFDDRKLTKREMEVLSLIGQGCSNKQIAETLFVGKKTVESHLNAMKIKLNCLSVRHLISKAFQKGLVHLYAATS
jgi:DNA-binding CsgD family transcriptional regulator